MRTLVSSLLLLLLGFGAAPLANAQDDDPNASPKDCYDVRGDARYRALGYNHIVIVTNRCKKALSCEVWTSVDPTPRQPLQVAAGATGEVTTRLGSPASSFSAYAECK